LRWEDETDRTFVLHGLFGDPSIIFLAFGWHSAYFTELDSSGVKRKNQKNDLIFASNAQHAK